MLRSAAAVLALALASIAATGCVKERTLPAVRTSGDRALARNDYQQAYADFSEAVERLPGDWESRKKLGKTLLVMERPREAREHLAVAWNIKPNDSETIELLAQAMLESGDKDGMFRLLRTRAEERRTVEDYLRFARFAARAGDTDEAERAYLTAARFDRGTTADIQTELADFYMSVGKEPQAVERLRMALYLAPTNSGIQDRIRTLGQIPGPTFAVQPLEARSDIP